MSCGVKMAVFVFNLGPLTVDAERQVQTCRIDTSNGDLRFARTSMWKLACTKVSEGTPSLACISANCKNANLHQTSSSKITQLPSK